MEMTRELYAAIGEVVVEATRLEYGLAQLVATRWGWSAAHELAMVARGGVLRRQLDQLVVAEPDWTAVRTLRRDSYAVLNDRHVLVHSLVVHLVDEDDEVRAIELWHPNTGSTAALPSVSTVREHAFDIGRCFVAAVRTTADAERRFKELGAANAPRSPRLRQADDLGEADGLAPA
ncbi:hypothetical protein [Actinophytocola sp.]|uniref:hypothetical protein n=1 Tax=Actinophytocola sp. TaxID=1872138 RepID=UPI00389B1A5E